MLFFGCHEILMLGRSPIKLSRCPYMSIDVDWGAKQQLKQNKNGNSNIVVYLKRRLVPYSKPHFYIVKHVFLVFAPKHI